MEDYNALLGLIIAGIAILGVIGIAIVAGLVAIITNQKNGVRL